MVTRYLTGSLKQCSPARAQAMAGAKRPSKAGFGTRSECKKWALAKTNASHNPSRDAQCAAVISSTWGAKLIARATRVPRRYRMSSASILLQQFYSSFTITLGTQLSGGPSRRALSTSSAGADAALASGRLARAAACGGAPGIWRATQRASARPQPGGRSAVVPCAIHSRQPVQHAPARALGSRR